MDGLSKGNLGVTRARGIIRDWKGDMILGFVKLLGIRSNYYVEAIAMFFWF